MGCVLMIEDDAMVGQMLGAALEEMGHAVIWARTGAWAIEYMRCAVFDLVTLDLGLPDMNGKILLHKIRISTEHRDVPVLVVTADQSLRKVDEMRLCGANGYIMKPFEPEVLKTWVGSLLNREEHGVGVG